MKKLISILFAMIIVVGSFAGCEKKDGEPGNPNRFRIVEDYGYRTEINNGSPVSIFVDTETGVMYLRMFGTAGGVTVLLNSDGTPLIWEGE